MTAAVLFGEFMSADLATYASLINTAWNSHDIEKVLSFYAPECISDDVGQAALLHGREDLRVLLTAYWKAFPDLQFSVMDIIVEDKRLAIAWVAQGTHQGTIMNIPPTGHRVQVRGMSMLHVKDGLVVHAQYIWDIAGMLRHMGLLPEL
jgi:steroid delta-isomerase-like uncharacterized protein